MNPSTPRPRFDLARARAAAAGGKRFWTSLDELLDEDGFRNLLSAEFPQAASLFDEPGRRQFLKLMGASLLLGGLTACDDQTRSDHALPYVNQPEDMTPGVPRFYATAVLFEGYAQPVIATTYSGRPVKLDGNPEHPATRGASDAFMQSAIFGLYDPDRSKTPLHDGRPSTWNAFGAELLRLRAHWQERQGEGLRILTGATSSPTLLRQMADLTKQYPRMRWHRFEPIGTARQDEAMTLAFGRALVPHYRLDRCEVIVSIDADLLGPGPHQVINAAGWAQRRGDLAPGQGRVRMHVAESVPSPTGTVASTRLPCDASRLPLLVQAIGSAFSIAGFSAPELNEPEQRWLDRAVTELRDHGGRSLFVVGQYADPALQAVAGAINDQLKNAGATVWYSEPISLSDADGLSSLAKDIGDGAVDSLCVLDCNPAYCAPGGLEFQELFQRIPHRFHAGLHVDETALLCPWHVPLSHPLEGWSDARAVDGTTTIIQPVVQPLYSSRSIHQLVDMLLGDADPKLDAAVRATWTTAWGDANPGDKASDRWNKALHDGLVEGTAAQPVSVTARVPAPIASNSHDGDFDVVIQPDPTIWDGRFANIAWLQEMPKPMTKITWDNVVAVSPSLASTRGLSNGDVVEVEVTAGHRKIKGPVWIVPGLAANTIALTYGYGRQAGGELAKDAGFNTYSLLPNPQRMSLRGTLRRLDARMLVATTQAHHRMDGFDFVREVSVGQPMLPKPKAHETLYPDWGASLPEGDGPPAHAWAMTIDLDLCIGCNACVAACNTENNVLVVGKDQVARGREMLWLRVDHYHTGDPERPTSSFQPVPCMHCEKAPCEMGCPVHATAHSPDGINQMVYNRCIGTRTCSSYCPYKVRRFNWYDYRKLGDPEQAAKNPDVTVRSRGVMEKCTYCTQRIQSALVQADKEGRNLHRDEVVTACQQVCPTKAIVFGDLSDKDSAVSKRRASGRNYALLEELGTRPRTTYLARWNDEPGDGNKA